MTEVRTKLRELLGDGARADGFEDFLAFANEVTSAYTSSAPDVQRVARFMSLVSMACVEGANEMAQRGDDVVAIVDAMLFGTAIALACAIISPMDRYPSAADLRLILTKSFNDGVERAITSQGLK